jgi:hypothetical protein
MVFGIFGGVEGGSFGGVDGVTGGSGLGIGDPPPHPPPGPDGITGLSMMRILLGVVVEIPRSPIAEIVVWILDPTGPVAAVSKVNISDTPGEKSRMIKLSVRAISS